MVAAVLTGDIVASSERPEAFFEEWPGPIRKVEELYSKNRGTEGFRWELYRGDGFQILLPDPKEAMRIAVAVRAALRSFQCDRKRRDEIPDARISIGLGRVELTRGSLSMSRGDAFERSGRGLDGMKARRERLNLQSPWEWMNEEFEVSNALADVIISSWSAFSAEAFLLNSMEERSKKELAGDLGISASAFSYRLKHAHSNALLRFLKRYEKCSGKVLT
jgi:hypothetical protein